MDVTATTTATATQPARRAPQGPIATIAVQWRKDGSVDLQRSHSASGTLTPVGSSFNEALRAGLVLSRRTPEDLAVGLMQYGSQYYLTPLAHVTQLKEGIRFEVDTRIDGTLRLPPLDPKQWGKPYRPQIGQAVAQSEHPNLRAVVGAYSWIDLRNAPEGARTRIPKLS